MRDRVSGRVLALKVLSRSAGEAEIDALVQEAVALSGLEGLGVPRVVAFGALKDGRRYMVRELVDGRSLDDVLHDDEAGAAPWVAPLASACDQLTVVHRSGLLHGDVKPANIIVGADGRGTLVDLGLAAPWREGGTAARGLTPKYAAPELFSGEPLTVRAEVYALGATLSEALARRGDELGDDVRIALAKVAARATETAAAARWPSVDELASALRRAAGLEAHEGGVTTDEPPWPVLGLEATSQALLDRVKALPPGGALALRGQRGSGRTTLARRLAWTLGVAGRPVALIDEPASIELELAQQAAGDGLTVIVDDGDTLGPDARTAVRRAVAAGARLVWVGDELSAVGARGETFAVPPLDERAAAELVQRSVPSLPDALRAYLVGRVGGRPGTLRAAVRLLADRVVVSKEDVDAALGTTSRPSMAPAPGGRTETLEAAERAIEMGRFDEAARALDDLGAKLGDLEQVRVAIGRARIALGRGDTTQAVVELSAVEARALEGPSRRGWQAVRTRAHLRAGEYAEAARLAQAVVDGAANDALAADALSARGVALAFTGE
ncbi:MAG TPA: protein kinase, partial [Polyangiaceae bacterium]|nr:protein kinase [Polyangiaceae bacterium]